MSKINPIKWTTKRIKDLMIQIEQSGSIPRYNPFFNNDSTLLAADINFGLTEEEFIDKTKVSNDVFYFATTHAKVKTDEGEVKEIKKLRNYQKNLLYHFKKHKFNVVLASRQIGKCVHPFTHVEIEMNGERSTMPIFELFYRTKPRVSLYDKTILGLLRVSYRLQA